MQKARRCPSLTARLQYPKLEAVRPSCSSAFISLPRLLPYGLPISARFFLLAVAADDGRHMVCRSRQFSFCWYSSGDGRRTTWASFTMIFKSLVVVRSSNSQSVFDAAPYVDQNCIAIGELREYFEACRGPGDALKAGAAAAGYNWLHSRGGRYSLVYEMHRTIYLRPARAPISF